MDEAQSVSFDMFKMFIKICDTLNLKWYMINGSALGAVKYQGFIQWDDDMDIGLMRKDYEIFLEKAQEMLPPYIFVQNYRTDKNFPHIYTKLRNSNTTFIESGVRKLDINHGIYIDIFPLDIFPGDAVKQAALQKRKKMLIWKSVCALDDRSKMKIRVRNLFFKFLGYHRRTQKYLAELDSLISSYNDEQSSLICNHGDRMDSKRVMPKEFYGEGTKAIFEGIEVTVPERIDEYLTYKYGDWRAELPESEKKTHHKTTVCDVNKPYTEYMK